MKKSISLILAVIMAVSVFAGCQDNNNSQIYNPNVKVGDTGGLKLPLTDSTDKIVWSVDSSITNLNDSFVIKRMREATGVNLELLIIPAATSAEKIKVLAASNSLPDIVGQGIDVEFADDLCNQGAFAAVSDYLDIVPNFKRFFVDNEKNNWVFKSYAAKDGKLYGLYGYDYAREINTGVTMYRKDIFDKHGIKMWNSPETFYDALKKLKELYPDSTPYTIKSGDAIFRTWSLSWGMKAQEPYYEEADGKWYFTDIQPEYKEMLDFMKKCYNEGLIDPEFLTNTQAQWSAKLSQPEKAFVTTDWIGRLEQFEEQTKDTFPEFDLRFAPPMGPDQTYPEASQVCWPRYVSAKSKNIETSFKLLDFCLSDAGAELISMGAEGETYTLDENGKAKYIGMEDKIPQITELEEEWGMFIQGMYLRYDRRSAHFQYSEREQEGQDYAQDPSHISPADPILVFTAEEKEEKNQYLAELLKSGREFSTKYVLNKNYGDKEWNEWLKTAEKQGAKKVEEIYNRAQERFNNM